MKEKQNEQMPKQMNKLARKKEERTLSSEVKLGLLTNKEDTIPGPPIPFELKNCTL